MQYKYIARDNHGKRISAVTSAENIAAVIADLKTKRLLPLKIDHLESASSRVRPKLFSQRRRLEAKEIVVFSRQLASTLDAGLPLIQALDAINDESGNEYLRDVIENIIRDIQGGASFSKALSKYPKAFPGTYIAIVESGEATGGLNKVMARLATYLEETERIKGKVKSAITYPLFLIGFASLVLTAVVLFIIPRFKEMFEASGVELPLLTRIVIGISEFSLRYWPVLLLGGIVLGIIFILLLKIHKIRFWFHALVLKIPIIGKEIIHKFLMSRFCSTMGSLITGGVALAVSFEITERVAGHLLLKEAIAQVRTRVISGSSIASAMGMHKIFTRLVTKMIGVGEKTGCIADMFQRTAEYYDTELEHTIQKLSVLIEPILIIVVGVLIGITVVALYLPIFRLAALIR